METETELDVGMGMETEIRMSMETNMEMGMEIEMELNNDMEMEMGMRNATYKMQLRQSHRAHASRFPNAPTGFSNTHTGSPTQTFGVIHVLVLFNYDLEPLFTAFIIGEKYYICNGFFFLTNERSKYGFLIMVEENR